MLLTLSFSLALCRRCMQLLGFDEYIEEMTDGLQILRYNLTTAYTSHIDYLEDNSNAESYDYDTSGKGGNRFATILLYFTTLGENDGGETVFPLVWPPSMSEEHRIATSDGLKQLRDSGDTKDILNEGSWEEQMAALCRTRLAIRPQALRAVLFYSQFPNGTLDPLSKHGGCPILSGTKLAANLWTWSAIRPEYKGGPQKFHIEEDEYGDNEDDANESSSEDLTSKTIQATFRNRGIDERFRNVQLYYDEDGYFGDMGPKDEPIIVNTYAGHVWNVKDSTTNVVLQTFIIADGVEKQLFEV
jgi:2OG-Fe(II) oxygenase superfamily